MTDIVPMSIEPGKYRHTKSGKLYEVVGVALETETSQPLVVYRPLYANEYELFARPYDMFVGKIDIEGKILPRFERIDS